MKIYNLNEKLKTHLSNYTLLALVMLISSSCQLSQQKTMQNVNQSEMAVKANKGPVSLSIEVINQEKGVGDDVEVLFTINSNSNIQSSKLEITSGDEITFKESEILIGNITKGEPHTITVQAGLKREGYSNIKAVFTGVSKQTETKVFRSLSKYAFIESNRSFFEYGSKESVSDKRLNYLKNTNKITDSEFRKLNDNSNTEEIKSKVKKKVNKNSNATINVSGIIKWEDSAGNFHPLMSAEVEIIDEDLAFDDILATVVTNAVGEYKADVELQSLDDLDIFIKVYARNTTNGFYIVKSNTSGNPKSVSDTYNVFSIPTNQDVTNDITVSLDIDAGSDIRESFSVHQSLIMATNYINSLSGSYLPGIAVEFPGLRSAATSYFSSSLNLLHILKEDRYDWDVIHHEYAHYVMSEFSFEDNPGGSHSLGEHLSDSRANKGEGIKLAWGEGYPTYFGITMQQDMNASNLNIPLVGDLNYDDTEDLNTSYSLENNTGPVTEGEDDEGAVQRILWDIYDNNIDNRDSTLALGGKMLWDKISVSGAVTLSDTWNTLTNGKSAKEIQPYAKIFADFKVSPEPTMPAVDTEAKVTDTPLTFMWDINGGGTACCPDNEFTVIFYNEDFTQEIFESSKLTTNSYTPTNDEWKKITATGESPYIHWIVKGSNTTSPATGIYHSPSRRLKIDGIDIAFVIDDTGSMGEEIGAVRSGLQSYIATFTPASNTIFQLTTFKDNFRIFDATDDLPTIQSQVASLFALGGNDCPEASIQATSAALKNVKNGGTIFLATDAAPHPGADVQGLIDEAVAKSVKISIILSGDCAESEGLRLAMSNRNINMEMPYSNNSRGAGSNEMPTAMPPDDPTGIDVFSELAEQTGGIFVFLPEINDGTSSGSELFENTLINIINGTVEASVISTQPNSGPRGGTLVIKITGSNTNFNNNTSLDFGSSDISVLETKILSPTSLEATIIIDSETTLGLKDIIATSDGEIANGIGLFEVTPAPLIPTILSVSPPSASQGANLDLTIFGSNTNFSSSSIVSLGSGITISDINVESSEILIASIQVAIDAPVGFRDVVVTTESEIAAENITGPFLVTAQSNQIIDALDDFNDANPCNCEDPLNGLVDGIFLFHKILTVTGTAGQVVEVIAPNDGEFRDENDIPIPLPFTLTEVSPGVYQSEFWNRSDIGTTVVTQMNGNTITNRNFNSTICSESVCNDRICNINDWQALKALYQNTDGDNWQHNDNWEMVKADNPPVDCDLSIVYGIKVNDDKRVAEINLYNNNLNGTIPAEIGDLNELTALYLSSVNLSGEIPVEIAKLSKLKYLFFVASGISGAIPPELGQLSNLKDLRLSYNQLSGEIPIELTNLPNLDYLSLGNNQLSGTIQPELANLSNLRWLSLSDNQLTGSIPAELSTLRRLRLLTLDNNDLSGCYPSALSALCDQLIYNFFGEEDDISSGNNLDASWEDFCIAGEGDCNTLRLGDLNNFYLYPNPTTGKVFVQFENTGEQERNISIYNISGKKYASKQVTSGKSAALNIQHLPKGIYIVEVSNGYNSRTQKLIIQ